MSKSGQAFLLAFSKMDCSCTLPTASLLSRNLFWWFMLENSCLWDVRSNAFVLRASAEVGRGMQGCGC